MNFSSLKLSYICSGVLLLILIISNYSESFENPSELMKSLTKIIQSKNDPRIYRHISLPNQLSCILISDKDTDKSAASISVGVGSLEDPKSTSGLAHFLEHMLFLGTEKYPNQSEYKAYLMKNSGSLNAYTASTETVYYFSCANQAFSGALDRFSQFFIKPLFNEDCTEREMQAVHSEHQKNLINDAWKHMQLVRSSALKHTAYNHFSTGDLNTLKKEGIREELKQFYQKYYSSNLMKLVLYGNQSIDDIEKLAYEYFSPIKDFNIEPLKYKDVPFTEENLGRIYHIKTIKKNDKLEFIWYLENLKPHFASNPASYISFILGHEGKNSLLSYLIDEGLALELSSGEGNELDLFSTLEVSIKLTKKGMENYREVCGIVFKFLKIIKEKGVQKYIFDEKQYINQLKFDFKEKEKPEGYVIHMASNMQIYPTEHILDHAYLMKEFQPELIQKVLDQMTYRNMRIYVSSESFENLESIEPIYNTPFTERKIDEDLIKLFENPTFTPVKTKKTLDLPVLNNFLPKNLSKLQGEAEEIPKKIFESNQTQVFFKQDNKFLTPKANIYLRIYIRNDGFPFDIKSYLSAKIWNEMIYNELRESIYLAKMANLNTSLLIHTFGLDLHFTGFNDGLLLFVNDIATNISNPQQNFDKEKFNNIKHDLLQEYSDFQKGQPLGIATHLAKILTENGPIFYINDLHESIKGLTFEDFLQNSQGFFKMLKFEWFAIGNIVSEDIKNAAISFEKNFRSEALANDQIPKLQVVEFEKGNVIPFYEFHLSEIQQKNSAALVIFQEKNTPNPQKLNYFWLLADIMREPYFTRLRTNEQLGYLVSVRPAEARGVCHLEFLVQSERKDPQYLASRVWSFLEDFKEKILKFDKKEFEKFKQSILVKILEKDLSIYQEGGRFWGEIVKHRYDFRKKENDAKVLETMNVEEFISFANELLYEDPKNLEVLVVCPKHKEENEKSFEKRVKSGANLKKVVSFEEFKNNKKLYEDYFHI